MLTGQDGAGKTSLKKSLKGICFNPEEDSTVGIDVDPCHFKVTTETWRTGMTGKDQDFDAATSFDYYTARCIVASLKGEGESILPDTAADETARTINFEIPAGLSRDAEHIQTSSDPAPTLSKDVNHVRLSPNPPEWNPEGVNHPTPQVPEEIAVVTETLLQGDWENNKEDVYSTLWDFAGQTVYYVTHPLFLTQRGIYCLVYDLSLNPRDRAKPQVKQGVYKQFQENFNLKTNLDYLDFWMTSVSSLARSQNDHMDVISKSGMLPERYPPVFLVCTHADTPYGDGNPRNLAYEIFGCLKSKPYGAHLFDVFVVDNTKSGAESECSEVVRLRQEILAVAKQLPNINEAIPIKWLKFDKTLSTLKNKGHKYISLESAKAVASQVCNINKDKELETLMNYLHDLRSLIHFNDSPALNKLVVLDPQWLVDVLKKVITVQPAYHCRDCREKNLLDLWCQLERDGILHEKLLAHVWEPLLDNSETIESLVGIMEKFSLLCPWPSDTSDAKSYLVPSMLKSHPPKKITQLVESAKIPSLFLKFENGQVPPSLFPRLVLQFFQWGKGTLWSPVKPQLFHDFARFFTLGNEGCSVILLCHSSSIEVVYHTGNLSLEVLEDLFSVPADSYHGIAMVTRPCAVRRQLDLLLDCMCNEFCWLKNIRYETSVLCPVCSRGGAVDYCHSHDVEGCKEEQCLHFLAESEIYNAKQPLFCTKSASAHTTEVQVMQFAPWFDSSGQQVNNLTPTVPNLSICSNVDSAGPKEQYAVYTLLILAVCSNVY